MDAALLYTRRFFPFIADASLSARVGGRGTRLAALAVLRAVPERRRKVLLSVYAASYIAWFAGPAFALAHLALAAALRWALSRREHLGARLLPALAAGAACVFAAAPAGLPRVLGLYLLALSTVKALSLCVDAAADDGPPAFDDVYLYLAGGVPCNFMGPKYTFATFRRSYLARPYPDVAVRGTASLALGAAKFAAAAALASAVPASAGAGASGLELWGVLLVVWGAALLRLTAIYDMLQGANRLFGFDVPDQFDAPWLAQSPLDFWRRFGVNNRDYLLKYVFHPARRLGAGLYAALAAAFLASAAWNLLLALLVGSKRGPHNDPASVAMLWAGFFVVFTAAAALEAASRARPEGAVAARFDGGPARLARVVLTFLFIAALQAPMPYVLNLSDRGPNAPAESLARRCVDLYARLLGLRRPGGAVTIRP